MDEPSTDGLYQAVVGDDLRDVGVPMLLFTAAALDATTASDHLDHVGPDEVNRAAADTAIDLAGLALFGTDAYLLQRALGEQTLGRS